MSGAADWFIGLCPGLRIEASPVSTLSCNLLSLNWFKSPTLNVDRRLQAQQQSSATLQHCWWQMVANATGSNHFSRFPELARRTIAAEAPPCLPCPNLACNLDFAQDDTTAPSRAKAARVSSRGASASSLATSAEATRSARLQSMRGTAANTAGCKSALEWG